MSGAFVGLSNAQIKYIQKNIGNYSAEKFSKDLNVSLEDVQKIIDLSTQKSPFYFYLILILIPILFFVLLEFGLRTFDYGYNYDMWVNVTDDYLILNPDVARRYFSTVQNVPTSIEDTFLKEKSKNTFRVFVLGGSSAAGYPYMPMGSFSRYIRRRLELVYPASNIEVINLSLSATNTFTVRDFIPCVIEQQPDLILIYSGHNEYYGALGVGSLESISSSREMVNLFLYLNKYKTTQLIKDFIQWISSIFISSERELPTGTLMARMAENKSIPINSEDFNQGIAQFEGNMNDILEMITNAKIPVIISTLASNLKDQRPFISLNEDNKLSADIIYNKAAIEYNSSIFKKADSLFRLAKDLDALRFRAPEKINFTIKELAKKYKVPLIDSDSLFCFLSPNKIVGNNLMTDHLHPTLEGYHEIGNLFYNKMIELNFVPKNSSQTIPLDEQDKLTRAQFVMSEFDSIVADYRIKLLKNDWPFINPKYKKSYYEICKPKRKIDSLVIDFLSNKINWSEGIEETAEWYFHQKNLDGYLDQMNSLLYQYPIIVENFLMLEDVAMRFLKIQDYNNAEKVLLTEYNIKPNSFSSKWLGQIQLNKGNISQAIKLLEQSVAFNQSDLQTLYNLAGAYAMNEEYSKALDKIEKVLQKDKNYTGANELYSQLKVILNKPN
jgi:tetratricopeptide (TPR) repeat protein